MKTCGTCDWWCYGTYPSNTCDRWERTVWECEVPDDVMAKVLHEPTDEDMEALARDIAKVACHEAD